jgi:ElaB/YqjD/DUF883 family membrane-anchored ribosome-binding protein
MSEENPKAQTEASTSAQDTWEEVGKQFQQLGESLAAVFQNTWNDEKNRKWMQEMKSGLQSAVENVRVAIHEASASSEGQELRGEVKRTAEKLRDAGEQTAQELRPHVLSALRKVSEELQKFADHMEKESEGDDPTQGPVT